MTDQNYDDAIRKKNQKINDEWELHALRKKVYGNPDLCPGCKRIVGMFSLGLLGVCRSCTGRLLREVHE